MNLKRLFSIVLLFITVSSINIDAHVGLDFPVGGETFEANSQITIRWHIEIDHGDCNWDLYLSTDGGSTWNTIVLDLPKTRLTYNWNVPSIATQLGKIRVVQDNLNGTPYDDYSGLFTIDIPSGIQTKNTNLSEFKLFPAFPNPFNPTTKIKFQVPEAGFVTLKIYDLLGNEVATLVNAEKPSGIFEVSFDGSNLASGVYVYRLSAGNLSKVRKLMLLK